MDIEQYIGRLAALDIKLWLDGEKLKLNAPDGVLTAELRAELAARKPEIVEFLSRAHSTVTTGIPKAAPGAPIPLTLGQERIWALAKMDPSSSVYNVPVVFRIDGKIHVAALEKALSQVIARHEALRTVFTGEDAASARQVVREAAPVVVPVSNIARDIGQLPKERVQQAVMRLVNAEVRAPFDLERGPLWRVRLFVLGERSFVLAFAMHHIVFDGMSKTIFLDDLGAAYRAALENRDFEKAPCEIQFSDYAAWQRARLDDKTLQTQLAYWQERLAGEVPPLLTPNPRPRVSAKGRAASVTIAVTPALCERLWALAKAERVSMFILLLTGFYATLNRITGQEDLVVCAPMASREQAQLASMVGYFNNVVALRADLSGEPTFRELLAQVRKLAVEAYDNQFVPLQHIAALPNLARTPLTRAMFSFQETSSRKLDLPQAKTKTLSVRKGAADFDLAFYMEAEGPEIGGLLDFNLDIFTPETVQRMLQRFVFMLGQIAQHPDKRLSDYAPFGRKPHNVESILVEHPQIDAAAVVREPRSGLMHAYLVLNEHDVPNLDDIRAYARSKLPDYAVPASFIPLDEMPLAADGSIDRAALPPPASGRAHLSSAYEAPRTPLESQLAELWKKVLWLDFDVGIHDRFRELGGHSLLSVQLVTEIESKLGRQVPARALATLNTVAELAEILEKGEDAAAHAAQAVAPSDLPADIYHGLRSHTASWEGERTRPESVMVGLQTRGTQQPLFWCLQRFQELQQLARYLGPEQPVYGMRSGNRVMVKTQENIEKLAAHYVGEILEARPEGPYLLGGNCQAASIAFEIARQLQQRGHSITLLVLQERFVAAPYDGPVALLFGDRSMFNPYLQFRQPELGWHKFYSGPVGFTQVKGEHGQFFREPNVQILTSAIKSYIEAAQSGTMADHPPRTEAARQALPPQAYRAKLQIAEIPSLRIGERTRLRVQVANASGENWLPTPQSGLFVGSRWLNRATPHAARLDGRAALENGLAGGSATQVELTITAPETPGRWTLEIDVVDEGVAWFRERGSQPCSVELDVHLPVTAGA